MARQHPVLYRKNIMQKTSGATNCPFPIERGIEIPPHYKTRKYNMGLMDMKPGESRFIPFDANYKKASLQTAFYNYCKEDTEAQETNGGIQKTWVHRMLNEDGIEGMRIFCVLPENDAVHGRSKVA